MPALLFEVRNYIACLTLNRSQAHNSLNPELIVQLADARKRVNDDGTCINHRGQRPHRGARDQAGRPSRDRQTYEKVS